MTVTELKELLERLIVQGHGDKVVVHMDFYKDRNDLEELDDAVLTDDGQVRLL